MNWTNPTSIQWTCRAKLFGKKNKAEWDTISLHSNTNLTRRQSLETFHSNYLSSNLHIPPPHPHISPNPTPAKVLSMQRSIRNQVLLLEHHSFCDSFPFPPSILLFQTTEGPSPAGISKSLQSTQEKLSPSKNGLLQISAGGMALRWGEERRPVS